MPMNRKTKLRFRWSHRHPLHRLIVRSVNRILAMLPMRPKYSIGRLLRRNKAPYALLGPGSTFVQVGAPLDTLRSGRSRGLHLAIRSLGQNGSAIIVEPDERSAAAFRDAAKSMGLEHVSVINCAAWHQPDTLNLCVDPAHPATNFTEGSTDYDADRRAEFQSVTVPADTLDNIVSQLHVEKTDLVSITTNGAEQEILMGMDKIIAAGLKYICLARTGPGYDEMVNDLGFEFLSVDDRGYTYVRRP